MSEASARILLVDDEESIQTLLAYPLRKEGYEVVVARDGREGLDQFAAGGEHDDRHLRAKTQLAADVEARAVGEHHVEQHEVRVAARLLERLGHRPGDQRVEALAAEDVCQRVADRDLVLHEEDRPLRPAHLPEV